jgi:hypothetical protein
MIECKNLTKTLGTLIVCCAKRENSLEFSVSVLKLSANFKSVDKKRVKEPEVLLSADISRLVSNSFFCLYGG